MTHKILLFKCWNCKKWGDFGHDSECECGVHVYEESDPHSDGQKVEVLVIDTHRIGCEVSSRRREQW